MTAKATKKPATSKEAKEILVKKKAELVEAQQDYRDLLREEKKGKNK